MKKISLVFALSLLFNGAVLANDACIQNAYTQPEMDKCGEITPGEADKELNRVYSTINQVYRGDKEFLTALKKSQLAWIKFREAEYEAHYPSKDKQAMYGTAYSMCIDLVEVDITIHRIVELKRWLKGVGEGDVCGGSMMRPQAIQEKLKSVKK